MRSIFILFSTIISCLCLDKVHGADLMGDVSADDIARDYAEHYEITDKIYKDFQNRKGDMRDKKIAFVGAGWGSEVKALKDILGDRHEKITVIEPDRDSIRSGKSLGYISDDTDTIIDRMLENSGLDPKSMDVVIWEYYIAGLLDEKMKEISNYESTLRAIFNLLKDDGVFYAHSDIHMLRFLVAENRKLGLFDEKLIDSENGFGDLDPDSFDTSKRIYAFTKKKTQ